MHSCGAPVPDGNPSGVGRSSGSTRAWPPTREMNSTPSTLSRAAIRHAGRMSRGATDLRPRARPRTARSHASRDADATQVQSEPVSVLDGGDVVHVARVHTKRIMTVMITVGTRFLAGAGLTRRAPNSIIDIAALVSALSRACEQGSATAFRDLVRRGS